MADVSRGSPGRAVAFAREAGPAATVQLLVLAKEPAPGQAKTRLCPPCTPAQAARIAAAALADTVSTVTEAAAAARTLVVSGHYGVPAGWRSLPQRGDGLGDRLVNAYRDSALPGLASLLVGMDTPQLTPVLLREAAGALAGPGVDAVLGPAEDGGWWALGLRDPAHAGVLAAVPMSSPRTGADTLAALRARGLRVALLPPLRDVDTAADALEVAPQCPPQSRFARAVASLLGTAGDGQSGGASPLAVYATALRRAAAGVPSRLTAVDPAGEIRAFPAGEWCGGLRDGDQGLLDRCAGQTLEVGCGPGRLATMLAARGQVTLGIDVSAAAVQLARRRGVPARRQDVLSPVPDEGSWRRLLLVDGSIGIGGDPQRLLRRCRDLVAPAGRILVEVEPPGTGSWTGELRIRVDGGALSAPFPWAYLGADDLARLAGAAGLRVRESWTEAGRWFASLSHS